MRGEVIFSFMSLEAPIITYLQPLSEGEIEFYSPRMHNHKTYIKQAELYQNKPKITYLLMKADIFLLLFLYHSTFLFLSLLFNYRFSRLMSICLTLQLSIGLLIDHDCGKFAFVALVCC